MSAANGQPAARGRRGGVVVRVDGALRFVAVTEAVRISSSPKVTPVPGGPPLLLGVTLHDGAIVPVLSIGRARAEMIVCQHAGEVMGLVGGEIVRVGTFDASEGGVEVAGQPVPDLDLPSIYAQIQASARSPRRVGSS